MKRNLKKIMMFGFFVALMSLFQASYAQEDPVSVIENTSDQLFKTLKSDKASLKKDPSKVYGIVEKILVPRFDFGTISQWVMGRSWRDATPVQREEFTAEFKKLLINSYAGVLLDYTDETLNVLPLPPNAAKGDEVTVRSEIISQDRPPIAINYSMIKSGSRWMVYDVSVEGVSIVANYRSEIRELVSRQGVEGMIDTLKRKNK